MLSGDKTARPQALKSTCLFWAAVRNVRKKRRATFRNMRKGRGHRAGSRRCHLLDGRWLERPRARPPGVRHRYALQARQERFPVVLPKHNRWLGPVRPTRISKVDDFLFPYVLFITWQMPRGFFPRDFKLRFWILWGFFVYRVEASGGKDDTDSDGLQTKV